MQLIQKQASAGGYKPSACGIYFQDLDTKIAVPVAGQLYREGLDAGFFQPACSLQSLNTKISAVHHAQSELDLG